MTQKLTLRSEDDYDSLIKLVLVGDSGVGKTNLIQRYVTNTFSLDSKATIGVEFSTKNITAGPHLIKAQIWDTAGQERFRSMSSVYYRGCVGAVIVFDLTSSGSFESIKRWLLEIRSQATENVKIMLIGNKSDLKQQRTVDQHTAISYAAKEGLMYMETSALDGVNVEAAFYRLVEAVYESMDRSVFESESDEEGGGFELKSRELSGKLSGRVIDISEPPQGAVEKGGGEGSVNKSCCG